MGPFFNLSSKGGPLKAKLANLEICKIWRQTLVFSTCGGLSSRGKGLSMAPCLHKKNVIGYCGDARKAAKMHANCDLQVCFYQIPKPSKQMQQHQTATLQTILQMVDDPNRPGTAEDSMK